MKYAIIFMLTWTFTSAFAQPVDKPLLNHTDENGLRQGSWIKNDDKGRIKYKGQFKDNIPFGRFTYYYPNGNVKAVSDFFNEGKSTRTVVYHLKGKKNAEGNYFLEKRDSVWRFYNEDEVLVSEESYLLGKKHGPSRVYYPSGIVSEEINYENEVKHGPWKQYFKDGKIKIDGTYISGELNGSYVSNFANGKPFLTGTYNRAMRTGEWVQYLESGEVKQVETYVDGSLKMQKKMNGVFEETYPSNIPRLKLTYKDGKLNGEFIRYYDAGTFVKEKKQIFEDQPEEEVEVLKDQKVQQTGSYLNNKLHGKITYYKENGKIDKTEQYNEGVLLNP